MVLLGEVEMWRTTAEARAVIVNETVAEVNGAEALAIGGIGITVQIERRPSRTTGRLKTTQTMTGDVATTLPRNPVLQNEMKMLLRNLRQLAPRGEIPFSTNLVVPRTMTKSPR